MPVNKDEFLPLLHLVLDVPFVDAPRSESVPANTFSRLRLELGGAKLEISNDVNPKLLVSALHFLRGTIC